MGGICVSQSESTHGPRRTPCNLLTDLTDNRRTIGPARRSPHSPLGVGFAVLAVFFWICMSLGASAQAQLNEIGPAPIWRAAAHQEMQGLLDKVDPVTGKRRFGDYPTSPSGIETSWMKN